MNTQREVIYAERRKILGGADLKANIQAMVEDELQGLMASYLGDANGEESNLAGLLAEINAIMPVPPHITEESLAAMGRSEVEEALLDLAHELYEQKEQELGAENMRILERLVMLNIIDRQWVEHLTAMENMREGIGLRAYGQIDPLVAYKREGHSMYQELQSTIQRTIGRTIFHVNLVREAMPRRPQPTATNRGDGSGPAGRPLDPVRVGKKVGRNDPCPCGSGKKYKKCHGAAA